MAAPTDAPIAAVMVGNAWLTRESGKTHAKRLERRVAHDQATTTGASVIAAIVILRTSPTGQVLTLRHALPVFGTDTLATSHLIQVTDVVARRAVGLIAAIDLRCTGAGRAIVLAATVPLALAVVMIAAVA